MPLHPTPVLKSLDPPQPRSGHVLAPISSIAQAALVESRALLRGTREVLIRHGSEVYRLRHTRNDKLILTK